MHSWVRYSVAVYLGLLMAGTLFAPHPEPSVGRETDFPALNAASPWLLRPTPVKPEPAWSVPTSTPPADDPAPIIERASCDSEHCD